MRQERTVQGSIFDLFAEHEIGRELEAMSQWLHAHRNLLNLVTSDLRRQGVTGTGRQGLPSEAVLRCALLKQYRQLSYEELAFHLEDSASFQAFAQLPWDGARKSRSCTRRSARSGRTPGKRSTKCCWPAARQKRLESGKVVRVDSTVTAALIHRQERTDPRSRH